MTDDIALLRLSRDASFSATLQPICLPFGEIFPDKEGEVFVAGWGVSHDRDCTTGTVPRSDFLSIFVFKILGEIGRKLEQQYTNIHTHVHRLIDR